MDEHSDVRSQSAFERLSSKIRTDDDRVHWVEQQDIANIRLLVDAAMGGSNIQSAITSLQLEMKTMSETMASRFDAMVGEVQTVFDTISAKVAAVAASHVPAGETLTVDHLGSLAALKLSAEAVNAALDAMITPPVVTLPVGVPPGAPVIS